MKNITISIKNKTQLTQKLEESFCVTYYKKPSLFSKLTLKNKKYPDLYFHQGNLDIEALEMITNSTIVIVNSYGIKEIILSKLSDISKDKINVVYPYLVNTIKYDENIKINFKNKYSIEQDCKLILFTGNDLNTSGLKSFLNIISQIEESNFKVIISSDTKQIEQLKLIANRLKLNYEIIMLDNYKNNDELYIISDIFLLPTKQKNNPISILKAIYYKNVVFLPQENYGAEILDMFSIMNGVDDSATAFKIDALLSNTVELTQIHQSNVEISENFDLNSRIELVKTIIAKNLS